MFLAARPLGYVQAALVINNAVGTNVDHVTSEDNKIADRISRMKSEAILLTEIHNKYQDHPSLTYCQCFHPSAKLTLLISDILLVKKFINPLPISRRILVAPENITT